MQRPARLGAGILGVAAGPKAPVCTLAGSGPFVAGADLTQCYANAETWQQTNDFNSYCHVAANFPFRARWEMGRRCGASHSKSMTQCKGR